VPESPVPVVSIIIPSHNRRDLLCRVLDELAVQDGVTEPFEVIVVADGCHDGTQAMVQVYRAPFAIKLVECSGVGPALARNIGVRQALSPLLLFLDDDVIPTRSLVAAHIAAQRSYPDSAVLGPYPPEPIASRDRFRQNMQNWWKAHFDELARPGHRFVFTDLLTGNLSIGRGVWETVGGLDPQFARAREDLELGVRLIKHGVPLRYAPAALGWHQEHLTSSPKSMLQRAKEEGRSDALMALKHPDLALALKVCWRLRRLSRRGRAKLAIIRRAGFFDPAMIGIGQQLIRIAQRVGLPSIGRRIENPLRLYCYYRGAAEGLGNSWNAFVAEPMPPEPPIAFDVDIAAGLEATEKLLTQARPESARIRFGDKDICTLPFSPGAERWSGQHLRAALSQRGAKALIPVLTMPKAKQGIAPTFAPQALSMIGTRDFAAQLAEGGWQWNWSYGD
jgi:GT2 family glycosyltransferase